MPRLMAIILIFAIALIVAALTAWGSLALWYRLSLPDAGRAVGAGVFLVFGLFTVAALASRLRVRAILSFAGVFALVLFWWSLDQAGSERCMGTGCRPAGHG